MDSMWTLVAQEGIDWNQLLDMPGILFVVGGAIAIVAIVSTQLRGYVESKQLNRLKANMVERGFTADEIARVIDSGRASDSDVSPKDPGQA